MYFATDAQDWTALCSCVFMEPNWCLTTYDCVKPLILHSSAGMRYKINWKEASHDSSKEWQSGFGYVDGFKYNAALGTALVYLDRSPFERGMSTGIGKFEFATIADQVANISVTKSGSTYWEMVDSNITFIGMGANTLPGSFGTLREKVTVVRNKEFARIALRSTNFTQNDWPFTQPFSALWHVDSPTYQHVMYTDPVHCTGDWGAPLVTSEGKVAGLLVGYPGPAGADGGPYVYHFNQPKYRWPQSNGCSPSGAVDIFVDLTHPAVQEWIAYSMSHQMDLKVNGPTVARAVNRQLEVPRGVFGPYTFSFPAEAAIGVPEIHIPLHEGLEMPHPRKPEVFFDYIYGTAHPPSVVKYRALPTPRIVLIWHEAEGVQASSSPTFHVYQPVPSALVNEPVVNGTNWAKGIINIGLRLRAVNDCPNMTYSVNFYNCSEDDNHRCFEQNRLEAHSGNRNTPTRCTQCNACVPHTYPWTEIKSSTGLCLAAADAGNVNVELLPCNGTDAQMWMYNTNGLIGHKTTGQCLSLGNLAANFQSKLEPCELLDPMLFKPSPAGGQYAGNWTIETMGINRGAKYCMYNSKNYYNTWQMFRGFCSSVSQVQKMWSADFNPQYYKCKNDGYDFYRTHDSLEPSCSCTGTGTGTGPNTLHTMGPEVTCGM
mmetsp:Transcript_125582/g.217751  ORF Transcript_125582/g.217751 Transcript_125582/m.217751 type:complete len:656 (-) Transcript_125582:285-2252(-)